MVKFTLNDSNSERSKVDQEKDTSYWKAIESRRREQCFHCGRFLKNGSIHSQQGISGLECFWSCPNCGKNLRETL